MPPHYKLTYFGDHGRTEFVRYILHTAGIEFEDIFVPINPNDPNGPRRGQPPVLEIDGKVFPCDKSPVFGRYLARETGLAGDSSWESALADMYVDGILDLFPGYMPVVLATLKGDQKLKHEEWNKFREGPLEALLKRYEGFLQQNGTGYLVGNKVTWADLMLVEHMERWSRVYGSEFLDAHPAILEHSNRIQQTPGLKAYLAKREPFVL